MPSHGQTATASPRGSPIGPTVSMPSHGQTATLRANPRGHAREKFQCPRTGKLQHRRGASGRRSRRFQCPRTGKLQRGTTIMTRPSGCFNALARANCNIIWNEDANRDVVSMPSHGQTATITFAATKRAWLFQCPRTGKLQRFCDKTYSANIKFQCPRTGKLQPLESAKIYMGETFQCPRTGKLQHYAESG